MPLLSSRFSSSGPSSTSSSLRGDQENSYRFNKRGCFSHKTRMMVSKIEYGKPLKSAVKEAAPNFSYSTLHFLCFCDIKYLHSFSQLSYTQNAPTTRLGFGQGVQGRSGKLSPCMCKETHCTCASSPCVFFFCFSLSNDSYSCYQSI